MLCVLQLHRMQSEPSRNTASFLSADDCGAEQVRAAAHTNAQIHADAGSIRGSPSAVLVHVMRKCPWMSACMAGDQGMLRMARVCLAGDQGMWMPSSPGLVKSNDRCKRRS